MLPVERGLIRKFILLHLLSFTIEIILFMRGAKQGFQATGIPHSPAQLRACFNCTINIQCVSKKRPNFETI